MNRKIDVLTAILIVVATVIWSKVNSNLNIKNADMIGLLIIFGIILACNYLKKLMNVKITKKNVKENLFISSIGIVISIIVAGFVLNSGFSIFTLILTIPMIFFTYYAILDFTSYLSYCDNCNQYYKDLDMKYLDLRLYNELEQLESEGQIHEISNKELIEKFYYNNPNDLEGKKKRRTRHMYEMKIKECKHCNDKILHINHIYNKRTSIKLNKGYDIPLNKDFVLQSDN